MHYKPIVATMTMRVPVKISHAKKSDTAHDLLASALSQHYEIARDIVLEQATPAGTDQFTADVAIPKYKMVVELQAKQDNKGILAEMKRERIARANGWEICRVSEAELQKDIDDVFYKVRRAIERTLWK
jgi:very-short-patch-repair endonuclease